MQLSYSAKQELGWWTQNIYSAYKSLVDSEIDLVIHTDASKRGWGITDHENSSGGLWSTMECAQHINWLELKAIEIGIKSFYKKHKHIQIFCDNTTAISYINNMGGMQSQECDSLSKEIWLWCCSREVWISAAFIAGKENKVADHNSRCFNEGTEWQLNPAIFTKIIKDFYKPDIDLFASRINKQLERYVSWKPDPEAEAVDAFCLNWSTKTYYIFPPFSMISKVAAKIRKDKASGILVIPDWPSQHWYPLVKELSKDCIRFKPSRDNLLHPQESCKEHPLAPKMTLLAITF